MLPWTDKHDPRCECRVCGEPLDELLLAFGYIVCPNEPHGEPGDGEKPGV